MLQVLAKHEQLRENMIYLNNGNNNNNNNNNNI